MRGIQFLKKHDVEFNTLTVVNKENSYFPLKVYYFLKEAGSGYMQFIPDVERVSENEQLKLVLPGYKGDAEVTNWSVESLQYGNFLCEIFDEWVRKDVGKYFVQIFDVALESWLGFSKAFASLMKPAVAHWLLNITEIFIPVIIMYILKISLAI